MGTRTHNLCFEQKYEKYLSFFSENFQFLEIKFSIYLTRRVFVMSGILALHLSGLHTMALETFIIIIENSTLYQKKMALTFTSFWTNSADYKGIKFSNVFFFPKN